MRWTLTIAMIGMLLVAGGIFAPQAQAEPGPPGATNAHAKGTVRVTREIHIRVHKAPQNLAREAYQRGDIKSLSVIRRQVGKSYDGRIIATKFVDRPAAPVRYIYMFRVLGEDGNVMIVHVDAKNANILQVRGAK
jgi:uncharacterized membrane protein YkoI